MDFYQKIIDIYNLINSLEVRGINNVAITNSIIMKLQEIIKEINSNNNEKIVIDNTKGDIKNGNDK